MIANPAVDAVNGSQMISPTVSVQITGDDGRYAWDVIEGCWYVTVSADGYYALTSPVVGVPPEVTDLDLALTADNRVYNIYLPKIFKTGSR